MSKKIKTNYDLWREENMKEPEFRRLYKEEEAKFSVSQKIKKLREKLGMTQQGLAKKVKTTQSAIARIESADYEGHSLSKLEEIAKALGAALVIDFIPKEKIKKSA
jgi:ribosome-binding protein aMBF1 (putative translation factor)